jgi:threonine/homoserine/homoserine lactone efflux protein
MAELAAFIGVAAVVIVLPGQDTALTIRNTLLGGRIAGVLTAVGVSVGQATWTIATAVGVGTVLAASEPAFVALRAVGAAYLVFLGARALWQAVRPTEDAHSERPGRRGVGRVPAFRQGLLSNLGNPKMLAFFTSLLPQFGGSFASLAALGFLFSALTLAWLTGYAFAVARAGVVLRRARVRRALEALTGTVLVAFGLRLAAER